MVVSTVTRFTLIVWLAVECLQINRRYFVGLIEDNFIPRSKLRRLIYKWQRLASRNSRTSLQNINCTFNFFFFCLAVRRSKILHACCFAACSKKKLHGLSPRANYTDRATADCRRSDCQLLRI
jgi:hypothetical protein